MWYYHEPRCVIRGLKIAMKYFQRWCHLNAPDQRRRHCTLCITKATGKVDVLINRHTKRLTGRGSNQIICVQSFDQGVYFLKCTLLSHPSLSQKLNQILKDRLNFFLVMARIIRTWLDCTGYYNQNFVDQYSISQSMPYIRMYPQGKKNGK